MDKDQSKETKNQALITALILIVLLSQTIAFVWESRFATITKYLMS